MELKTSCPTCVQSVPNPCVCLYSNPKNCIYCKGTQKLPPAVRFAVVVSKGLDDTPNSQWAEFFVYYKMKFFRTYQNGLVCTTVHGSDFFHNIIDDYTGKRKWSKETDSNFYMLMSQIKEMKL